MGGGGLTATSKRGLSIRIFEKAHTIIDGSAILLPFRHLVVCGGEFYDQLQL
jgi:hypothetical protein